MDEPTLRRLAAELLDELPTVVTDPADRERVAVAIDAALSLPEGQARAALNDTLSQHPSTRAWVRDHEPADLDRVSPGGLPGDPTNPIGLYYFCPDNHEDKVLLGLPVRPPRCSRCGRAMLLDGH